MPTFFHIFFILCLSPSKYLLFLLICWDADGYGRVELSVEDATLVEIKGGRRPDKGIKRLLYIKRRGKQEGENTPLLRLLSPAPVDLRRCSCGVDDHHICYL